MKKWFENYWYHYKWSTIIVSSITIFILISTIQMVTKEKPDVSIMYTGPSIFMREDILNVKNAFKSIMSEDYNDDGEKGVSFLDITMMTPSQIAVAKEDGAVINGKIMYDMNTKYNAEIITGESLICILDPYWYKPVYDSKGFMPLNEVLGYTPENAIDECGIRLSDTDFGKYFSGLKELPQDTILCFRRIATVSQIKGKKKEAKRYENNMQMFREVMAFKMPPQTETTDTEQKLE